MDGNETTSERIARQASEINAQIASALGVEYWAKRCRELESKLLKQELEIAQLKNCKAKNDG